MRIARGGQPSKACGSFSITRLISLPGMLVREAMAVCPSTSTDTASVTDTVESSVEPRRDDSEDGD